MKALLAEFEAYSAAVLHTSQERSEDSFNWKFAPPIGTVLPWLPCRSERSIQGNHRPGKSRLVIVYHLAVDWSFCRGLSLLEQANELQLIPPAYLWL